MIGAGHGSVSKEPDEAELVETEETLADAEQTIRGMWHELSSYEEHVADYIAYTQDVHQNEDVSAEDVASAYRQGLTTTLEQMERTITDVRNEVDNDNVLWRAATLQERLPDNPSKTYDGYNGETAASCLKSLTAYGTALSEQLDAAEDRLEDLYDVQQNLEDYLTGDETFEPVQVTEDIADAPDTPDAELQYDSGELETAIMEARGRPLKQEHGSYNAAQDQVQEMVREHLADWYDDADAYGE